MKRYSVLDRIRHGPLRKRGGFLPALLAAIPALLGALGPALAGGAGALGSGALVGLGAIPGLLGGAGGAALGGLQGLPGALGGALSGIGPAVKGTLGAVNALPGTVGGPLGFGNTGPFSTFTGILGEAGSFARENPGLLQAVNSLGKIFH